MKKLFKKLFSHNNSNNNKWGGEVTPRCCRYFENFYSTVSGPNPIKKIVSLINALLIKAL